ncbi:MAG: hypothetical protein NTX61_08325 [Bacteroidetes bacterium]|nr:hypothetical protein [Bacteroidota bacterium]
MTMICKVLDVFHIDDKFTIIGALVIRGKLMNDIDVIVVHNDDFSSKCKLSSLSLFKKQVKEVDCGQECAFRIHDCELDIVNGDMIMEVAPIIKHNDISLALQECNQGFARPTAKRDVSPIRYR